MKDSGIRVRSTRLLDGALPRPIEENVLNADPNNGHRLKVEICPPVHAVEHCHVAPKSFDETVVNVFRRHLPGSY